MVSQQSAASHGRSVSQVNSVSVKAGLYQCPEEECEGSPGVGGGEGEGGDGVWLCLPGEE